jgi:mannose-6-phosphate isomerase-like protein (cupin superfamily)
MRIALVFGVGLEHFFDVSEKRPAISVVRRAERLRLPDRPGAAAPSFLFESLDFPATDRKMEAFLAEFPAGAAASEPHQHAGAEFVYVISGALAIAISGTEVTLDAGDAAYFESDVPHSYRGKVACTAIVVVTA